ncbi:MAG: molybdenum cofactor biosynthesis protein MoaE [Phycisphaerales bacterium]
MTNHQFIEVALLAHPIAGASLPLQSFPESCGAECIFLGRTRREIHPVHGQLKELVYSAYESMAESVLRDIVERISRSMTDLSAVRVLHALGPVAVGEASVMVQVAAGHRGCAFEATRAIMDALKSEAPIWKQEIWADGTTWSPGKQVITP